MPHPAAGSSRHDHRLQLAELGSEHRHHRSRRIAEQAARDAVRAWHRGREAGAPSSDASAYSVAPAAE